MNEVSLCFFVGLLHVAISVAVCGGLRFPRRRVTLCRKSFSAMGVMVVGVLVRGCFGRGRGPPSALRPRSSQIFQIPTTL